MPQDIYGNSYYDDPTDPRGDMYAQQTMARASYGNMAGGMMMGFSTVGGGVQAGMSRMFQDLGRGVMPTRYSPPARVYGGYYGQYVQPTGFLSSLAGAAGLANVPRGTTAPEYYGNAASDFGERLGMGGAAAAMSLSGIGLSYALSTPGAMLGRGIGSIAAGAMGLSSASGTAGGMIAGAAGLLGSIALPMAGMAVGGSIMDAVSQRRDIQNTLEASSFRFVGAGSTMADPRGISGMSRQNRQQVTDLIRQMDVQDPTMNTQDLTTILSRSTQLGMFAGTSNMSDFKKKFKDITESVKSVVSVLHTTLEEGLSVMKDLKGIGIDPNQVKSIVQQADMTGRMAGRTGMEMLTAGMQGAELFRGTGISMQIGAQANMMNLAAVRAARDAGTLSQEVVAQAGGEEALSQRLTAGGLAFSQTGMGRGMGGAFFRGGAFSQGGFMDAMGAGGGNFVGMFQQAAGNLGNVANLRTYQANQEKFFSEMGKTFGGRGLEIFQMGAATSQAAFMSGVTGASREVEFINAMKEQGVAMPDIEARLAEMKGRRSIFESKQAAIGATRSKITSDEAAQNFFFNKWKAKAGDLLTEAKDLVARPLDRGVNRVGDYMQDLGDQFVTGIVRADIAGISVSPAARGRVAGSASLAGVDLDRAAFTTESAGGLIREAFTKGTLRQMGVEVGGLTDESINLGHGMGISEANFKKAMRISANTGITADEAVKMAKKEDIAGVRERIGKAIVAGKLKSDAGMAELIQIASPGKTLETVGSDWAAIRAGIVGLSFEGKINEEAKFNRKVAGVEEVARVESLRTSAAKFDQGVETMQKSAGAAAAREILDIEQKLPFATGEAQKDLLRRKRALEGAGGAGLTREVAGMLSGAVLASGKEREDLLSKAALNLAATYGSEATTQIISSVMKGTTVQQAKDLQSSAADIEKASAGLGQKRMADALREEVRSNQGVNVSAPSRIAADEAVKRLEERGIEGLSDKDLAAIKGTGMGAFLATASRDLSKLASGKLSREEIVKTLGSGLFSTKGMDLGETATRLMAGGTGTATAIADLRSRLNQGFVSDKESAVAGGGVTVGGQEQGSAAQQAAVQTAMNAANLAVMQGLAKRLNVQ